MRTFFCVITTILWSISVFAQVSVPVEDIIDDIYRQLTETEETDYSTLHEELMEYAQNPINLNTATRADLDGLHFLSDTQADAILLYVYEHPMQSLNELDLIAELEPYEIRNLKAFVMVAPAEQSHRLYAREVFHNAKHEIIARADARNIEGYTGDPVYAQFKYKFNYRNRVQFGFCLQRGAGAPARDMAYGGYLQLNDIAPYVKTIVAGNYQAAFGQGLVINTQFQRGKSQYVLTAGNALEGLKKSTQAGISSLHGVGTTLTFGDISKLKTEVSVLYSMNRANDADWKHTIGANVTFKHKRFKAGVTAVENLYTDSLRYYYESAAYNQNYFRGDRQAVVGINWRYNHGWFDLFGEVAAAQNQRWGFGTEVGCRFLPLSDVGLIVLYRYYSPTFDNTLGYSFSETSRINDENGLYIGTEIKRLKNWRFEVYGDIFRFSGIKYGINYSPSWGYDAMGMAEWLPQRAYSMNWKFRAREKGKQALYSLRYQFTWEYGGWRLRTQADGNLAQDKNNSLSWGVSVHQDIQYRFARVPLVLQFRAQGFDAREWANRVYIYENDVLYAFSTPASYGQGGRFYLNMRWQIIKQLAVYLRVSETVYSKTWAAERRIPQTRTDIHLLFRVVI